MNKKFRYILSGFLLIGVLIGMVLVFRFRLPKAQSTSAHFPRAQGPRDAPIQIVEYSDFQCPACQVAQQALNEILSASEGRIRVIYRHFPLRNHRWAPLAHHAAECAAKQGNFWRYHDALYGGQSSWSGNTEVPIETFMSYAKDSGLELDQFANCLTDTRIDDEIQEEILAGESLGVRSTPSFFVNGKLVVGADALRAEVNKLSSE
ncbi:MAG: thioredoxin domain-containing protein [Candidatus Omnitrophica bacterium]|nr:thioredoxin domain-containing protein [Candidatus Omnitrophota bacterium]